MTELFLLDRFCHFSTISYEIFVYNLFVTHYENNGLALNKLIRPFFKTLFKLEILLYQDYRDIHVISLFETRKYVLHLSAHFIVPPPI